MPGKEIEDKKQISFADTDARIMGKKGDFDYRYNAQISVDADLQIIVGQHISLNANDKQEMLPALEAIQESTGRLPEQMSVDNGYMSGDNLQTLAESAIDAYIATDKGEKKHQSPLDESDYKLSKSDFIYHEKDNIFTCPGGQTLDLVRQSKEGDRVYQGNADVCANCPYQPRCCQSQKGEARTINTDDKEPLRQQMNVKMAQQASKDIYGKRKVIVEPVFGQLKNSGFRGFSVRGKEKVAGAFSLICTTHNIKKIVKAIAKGLIRPEFDKWSTNPAI